jgi:prepilin-type N-terminal cleavage/methylation domain-containing protein
VIFFLDTSRRRYESSGRMNGKFQRMNLYVSNFHPAGKCSHTSYLGCSSIFPPSSVEARPSAPQTAFTLIELLVVIAIIAVLAAMLLGAFSKSKQESEIIVCKNHLHEMGLAMRMYMNDFNAYPYYCGWGIYDNDLGGPDGLTSHNIEWPIALQPYYPLYWTNASYHCPAYTGQIYERSKVWWGSYSYNAWGTSGPWATLSVSNDFGLGVGTADVTANNGMTLPPRKDTQVVAPSEMFCLMDSRGGVTNIISNSGFAGQDWAACIPSSPNQWTGDTYIQNPPQHGNNFNVDCSDGHAESVRHSYLFDPTNSAPRWNFDHQPHPELWGWLQ